MIEIKNVSFTYENGGSENGLHNVNLSIKDGETILLCGESGCGKTTLTRLINGLIPHYYNGKLTGQVLLDGKELKDYPLYQIVRRVGSVFQNPRTQFYNVDTTSEIVFGCENMALPVPKMLERLEDTTRRFNLEKLLGRSLFTLSGGEKQKIACASVDTIRPSIIVLDEPSSNLDISAIEDLAQVIRHWQSEKKTIIVAEHRLYYLVEIADRVIYLKNGRVEKDLNISEFRQLTEVQLKDMGLRSLHPANFDQITLAAENPNTVEIKDISFSYGTLEAVNIPRLSVPKGAIVAVLGNNGAGKTTFAKCLCGLEKKAKGSVCIDKKEYDTKQRIRKCYMVMQDVNHQLFTESVLDEILLSLPSENESAEQKQAEEILSSLNLLEYKDVHPMSLSGEQKQRVAIGSAIASGKEIIVFDEPTSGLDYRHMIEVAENLRQLSSIEKTLFIITHDPELISQCCDYFVFIEDGKLLWQGSWTQENLMELKGFFKNNQ